MEETAETQTELQTSATCGAVGDSGSQVKAAGSRGGVKALEQIFTEDKLG